MHLFPPKARYLCELAPRRPPLMTATSTDVAQAMPTDAAAVVASRAVRSHVAVQCGHHLLWAWTHSGMRAVADLRVCPARASAVTVGCAKGVQKATMEVAVMGSEREALVHAAARCTMCAMAAMWLGHICVVVSAIHEASFSVSGTALSGGRADRPGMWCSSGARGMPHGGRIVRACASDERCANGLALSNAAPRPIRA